MTREKLMIRDNYEVHDGEKIWSKLKESYLSGCIRDDGYNIVGLKCIDEKFRAFLYHRVIWYLINGDIPDGYEINHIDENKLNNHISNLNLMTHKENTNWGTRNERVAAKQRGILNTKKSKPIVAIKDGEIVHEFASAAEAERHGFNHGHVSACCNGKRETHGGYHWFWKYDWIKLNEK